MKISGTTTTSALGILPFLFLLGCQSPPERERTVTDDLGQRVIIKTEIKRIVSLVPSNSELVCILDCERLYGGTRYDRFPDELVKRVKEKKIKIIGGGFDPNLEMIIEIGPDLILSNGPSQQRVVLPLKRMGYPILSLYPQNIEGLKRDFMLLGEILDRKARAKIIVQAVEKGLRKIQEKTRKKKRIKVYLQTWPDPMITVGKGSFSQSLLTLAGGINVFEDMPFDSGKVSIEWIIKRNPEVLIFTDNQAEFVKKIMKRPEWRQIVGVKNNHICLINETYLRRRIQFLDSVEKIYECLFVRHSNEQSSLEPRGRRIYVTNGARRKLTPYHGFLSVALGSPRARLLRRGQARAGRSVARPRGHIRPELRSRARQVLRGKYHLSLD